MLVSILLLSQSVFSAYAADTPETVAGIESRMRSEDNFVFSPFDTIRTDEFWSRHSFSLDNFLEFWPRYFVGRLGPIGGPAVFSRYGMGRGRANVFLRNASLNDPQSDQVPLAMVATTSIGRMDIENDTAIIPNAQSNIEGVIKIVEPVPQPDQPTTMFELSKGDFGLRQRRVRFGSAEGKIGIDIIYDGLRNGGYEYDASGDLGQVTDMGMSATRIQGGNLRGTLPGDNSYLFSFRRHQNTFQGGLETGTTEYRNDGHLGMLEADLGKFRLAVYNRGYRVSVADSFTVNEATVFSADFPVITRRGELFSIAVAYEDILSRQEMGAGRTNNRLEKASAGVGGGVGFSGFRASYGLNVEHYVNMSSAWGGHLRAARHVGATHNLTLEARRSFRMPNLGELYLPYHNVSGTKAIGGNRYVKGETAIEGSVRLFGDYGGLVNEVRAMAMRANDPIHLESTGFAGQTEQFRPENGGAENLGILEDRFRASWSLLGFEWGLLGGFEYAFGDREQYFSGVPDWRVNAALKFGRSFFKDTSAIYLITEYQYTGNRISRGEAMTPFNVLNLRLDLRLIDAEPYLLWLNVLNEEYETVAGYLMTPRTFVFGIYWTLFD